MSYRIRYGKRRNRRSWWALWIAALAVWGAARRYDELARYVGGLILGPR